MMRRIDLGVPAVWRFSGRDALRYLNGQLTQDVGRLVKGDLALPACVTDAKGRLQYRVWITADTDGAFLVEGPRECARALHDRLTRYLIADDVEVEEWTGSWRLVHLIMPSGQLRQHAEKKRSCARFAVSGLDCWFAAGQTNAGLDDIPQLEGDELETFRIAHGVPVWGRELHEGLLPPEAGLDVTDICYHKGCYIGQEVISRIKSAGKLNKRLTRLMMDPAVSVEGLQLVDAAGEVAGEWTSIAPDLWEGLRPALAYVKRGRDEGLFGLALDGVLHPLRRS